MRIFVQRSRHVGTGMVPPPTPDPNHTQNVFIELIDKINMRIAMFPFVV